MEGKEKAGPFGGTFNKLICEEDAGTDDQPLYSNQEKKQQVSMSMVRPESCLDHYRLLAVSLAVLAVILLTLDIGLGVYYSQLTDGYRTITDINGEVVKLQASYKAAIQSRDDVKEQLERETQEQQHSKWELEHLQRRSKDYKIQADKIQADVAALRSLVPMIKEGCRHCLTGWSLMNSVCYYFALSDNLMTRTWSNARAFCKRHGADMALIDSAEKNLAIHHLINNYPTTTERPGFWIGLRDELEEEGDWKWLNGNRLTEGFWNDGEPDDNQDSDCAAIFPRTNPFKAWNDVPCSYKLKWICEMEPKSAS